ncbi:MAG: type II toxin-antitoxin system RelE/ParE family toxin [Bacteroidetes bacterium]|nr:type II toxin-antitoxin system RelE/ParE family toxin [Bacteroidota bacterium]
MALEIYWSKQAYNKFDTILEHLESEWGKSTSKIFVKKVYDFIDTLHEFPEIGSIENRYKNIRGFVLIKQLTLFYQIRDNKIILLNFYDNRQKPKKRKHY